MRDASFCAATTIACTVTIVREQAQKDDEEPKLGRIRAPVTVHVLAEQTGLDSNSLIHTCICEFVMRSGLSGRSSRSPT